MKINWKGGALLAPLPPVMVSCGTMEDSNIITVAWTGLINTKPPRTYVSIRPERHSYEIIRRRGEFVINLTTKALVRAADYCGMYTGAKYDKFEKCSLEREKAAKVGCPRIAQSPLSLECVVFDVTPLGSHDMFLADIVNVAVDDSLLDKNGRLRLNRAELAAFAHGEYYELGRRIAPFGFSAAKKG